mmetsp:Transcript_27487/g.77757  ORF Transcript_27487/g.77757 Transcript_27487/m.77757 type:complete len:112 (+) Transcript_27487:703-1038(+)
MMLYRAKQRGFLELDLLMGKYAEKNIRSMSDEHLLAFNDLLLEENPDLFQWLTGQIDPPEEITSNIAYKKLREEIAGRVASNTQVASKSQPGEQWIRGWSDSGDELKNQTP